MATDPDVEQRLVHAETSRVRYSSVGPELDLLIHQAAAAAGTSMAVIFLPDPAHPWSRPRIGMTSVQTRLAASLCAHAVPGPGVLAVSDASRDPRFACHLLVAGRPHVRFFAGAPLRWRGAGVGALCVLDDHPRNALSDLQASYLAHLADRVVAAIGNLGLPA